MQSRVNHWISVVCFVQFAFVFKRISSCEHFSANCSGDRPGKVVRAQLSRFEPYLLNVLRVACARVSVNHEYIICFPCTSIQGRIMFRTWVCLRFLHRSKPRYRSSRRHICPYLSTTLQPRRPSAATGSSIRLWPIRAMLLGLAARFGACHRSLNHTTTYLTALLAVHDPPAQRCESDNRQRQQHTRTIQRVCLPPASCHIATPPPSNSRQYNAHVADPCCTQTLLQLQCPKHFYCSWLRCGYLLPV